MLTRWRDGRFILCFRLAFASTLTLYRWHDDENKILRNAQHALSSDFSIYAEMSI